MSIPHAPAIEAPDQLESEQIIVLATKGFIKFVRDGTPFGLPTSGLTALGAGQDRDPDGGYRGRDALLKKEEPSTLSILIGSKPGPLRSSSIRSGRSSSGRCMNAGEVEAAKAARARERHERVLDALLFRDLAGEVAEDHAGIGSDRVAQGVDALLEEEEHCRVVVLATSVRTTIEEVSDWIDAENVGCAMAILGANGCYGEGHATCVKEHADLRRCDEIIARRGQERGIDPFALKAFPE